MNFNSKQQKPKLYFIANFIILFKKYQIQVTPDARHLTSFSSESVSLLIHFFLTNTEMLLLFLHLTEDSTSVEPSKRSSLEVEQWHQEHGRPLQLLLLHVAHHPAVIPRLLRHPAAAQSSRRRPAAALSSRCLPAAAPSSRRLPAADPSSWSCPEASPSSCCAAEPLQSILLPC